MKATKPEIRQRIKALLAAVEEKDAQALSLRAASKILALPEYARAEVFLAFLPMGEEIKTAALIGDALAKGKTVGVPRIEKSPEKGDYIVFTSLRPDYVSWPLDRYGIPHPPKGVPTISGKKLGSSSVFVLTPGLAFDRGGGRLGRGKGYYDRFLSGARAAARRGGGALFACGFCYAAQLLDEVPMDERDERVDLVVTEDGIQLDRVVGL